MTDPTAPNREISSATAPRPTAARAAPFARLAEPGLIFLVCLLRFTAGLQSVEFHPDESQWIATSAALEAFASADLDAPDWAESYWTLTHPPVARYVIGLGRRAGGYGAGDLNRAWRWSEDYSTNVRAGALPAPRLLWFARLPMALLAALTGAIGFVLLTALAGRVAGYGWAALFLCSTYLNDMLSRAMTEAPLLCAVFAAALTAVWIVTALLRRDPLCARRLGGRLLLAAVLCGLAAAVKLNGAALLIPLTALAVWVAYRLYRDVHLSAGRSLLLVALVLEAAAGTFVAVNPYLYRAPITRAARMVEQRLNEMRGQERRFPETRMPAGLERGRRIGTRVFADYAPFGFDRAGLVNGALCLLGLAAALARASSGARAAAPAAAAAAIVLLATAAVCAFPVAFSRLDWDRYYLLPEVFGTMFVAVGIAALVAFVRRGWGTHIGVAVDAPRAALRSGRA